MLILGIETSCDETSLALYNSESSFIDGNNQYKGKIVASKIFSQDFIHSRFGGVIPEIASRNHIIKIKPLYEDLLKDACISPKDIDVIGVTTTPGLIGSLFVGVSFAKGLGYALSVPVVPIHHLSAHILAAELTHRDLKPPYLALIVSGGHTHIFDVDVSYNFRLMVRTVDDAAGEVFDKVAKVIAGIYPGGVYIENLAKTGDKLKVRFPIAFRKEDKFSFSGLKTSVINCIRSGEYSNEDVAASFQHTVAKTLSDKVFTIADRLGRDKIVVSGGVASNGYLREVFQSNNKYEVYFPTKYLCTDNGDMIAYATYKFYSKKEFLSMGATASDRM